MLDGITLGSSDSLPWLRSYPLTCKAPGDRAGSLRSAWLANDKKLSALLDAILLMAAAAIVLANVAERCIEGI
jgi:hypothetical protein